MKIVKYIARIFKNINFKKMFDTAKTINKRTKKWTIIVIIDMIWCALRYGAGYNDYLYFGLYQLSGRYRETYITRGINNRLVSSLNSKQDMHKLDNKNEFNELFADYLKRDWIFLTNNNQQEFYKWIKNHKVIIAKPNNGSGGKGIIKLDTSDFPSADHLYQYLCENHLHLIEEVVKQKDYLNKIHDKSVNTIRIITITNGYETSILTSFLRVGNGSFVDNTCSGGMVVPIDIETGKTKYPGTDLFEHVYYKHPISNKDLVGVKIKDWDECVELVKKASKLCPTLKYIGWDVAVSVDGPCLIEANPYPGYYYQFPLYLPDKYGYLPNALNILERLNLKLK